MLSRAMRSPASEWLGPVMAFSVVLASSSLLLWSYRHELRLRFVSTTHQEDLQVTPAIDLGKVRPADKIAAALRLRNAGTLSISLKAPIATCDCISIRKEPLTLQPGDEVELPFTVHAPPEAGPFERIILFQLQDSDESNWEVRIEGNVFSRVWTVPASLEFQVFDDNPRAATLALNWQEGVQIDAVRCAAPQIEITRGKIHGRREVIGVSLQDAVRSDPLEGRAMIDVWASGEPEPVLRIPIAWRPAPEIRCTPPLIQLKNRRDLPAVEEFEVMVFARSEAAAAKTTGTSIVPWVKIVQFEAQGPYIRMRIVIQSREVPASLRRERIIRLVTQSGRDAYIDGITAER